MEVVKCVCVIITEEKAEAILRERIESQGQGLEASHSKVPSDTSVGRD